MHQWELMAFEFQDHEIGSLRQTLKQRYQSPNVAT